MDATLTKKANDLAKEFAGQATTLEEFNGNRSRSQKTISRHLEFSAISV